MTESIGFKPPPVPRPGQESGSLRDQSPGHSSFWPLLIILLTLIFTTVRDGIALQQRINQMHIANAQPLIMLQGSDQQAAFLKDVKKDLTDISDFDPKAAQILADFFPNPPAETAHSAPAKKAVPANSPSK